MTETAAPVHLRLRGQPDERTQRTELLAALAAAHLLGLAIGTHLRLLRGLEDPLTQLQARLEEAELRVSPSSSPPPSYTGFWFLPPVGLPPTECASLR